jgi:hypothetical protein
VTAALGIAAVAGALAAGGPAGAEPSPPADSARASGKVAHELAVAVARRGPRPAASAGERRAHTVLARRFRTAGLSVQVQRFGVPGRGRSRNVIGVFATPARCLRIVMAHTDTTPAGPGANDNASGIGVLGALAPRLERRRPRCDTWLVATGAEERVYTGSPDHLGALALVRRVRRRGLAARLDWALSLDEVGRDRPFWLRAPVGAPRRGVERLLLAAARRAGVPASFVRDEGTGNSDHREFNLFGLPAAKLGVGAAGEPCRHQPCDRPGRLRRPSFAQAQRLVEVAVALGPRRFGANR